MLKLNQDSNLIFFIFKYNLVIAPCNLINLIHLLL